MNNFVTKDKYKAALEQIKAAEGAKVYQVLGKAYLLRKNDELAKDYEQLIETTDKELAELDVNFRILWIRRPTRSRRPRTRNSRRVCSSLSSTLS